MSHDTPLSGLCGVNYIITMKWEFLPPGKKWIRSLIHTAGAAGHTSSDQDPGLMNHSDRWVKILALEISRLLMTSRSRLANASVPRVGPDTNGPLLSRGPRGEE